MGMQRKSEISAEKLKKIINRCDPDRARKSFSSAGRCGNEGIFKFCQYMKEIYNYPDDAIPYIRQWYEKWQSRLVDETGHKLYLEDVKVQACELWDRIKFPVGGQLAAAIENAKRRYDETIPELGDYGGEQEKFLALVCFELQLCAGEEPFYISGYDAAEVMGFDRKKGQKKARLTLKVFMRKGIISIAKCGNQRRATRYYYTGSPPIKRY